MLTRRGLLGGAAGAAMAAAVGGVLVEEDVLPGRVEVHRALGLNGAAGPVPTASPGRTERHRTDGVEWALCLPPGSPSALPVVVALGGRDQTMHYLLRTLALPRFLAASGRQLALVVVAGEASYYHRRRDGSDVGAVVLERVLPAVGARGHHVEAPAFVGWSMGGYGALLLASERLRRGEAVGAVAATSPAVWTSYDGSAPGAFDSPSDFDLHDVFARTELVDGPPIRVDCGRGDPFLDGSTDLARHLHARLHLRAGGHDAGYWRRVLPAQLTWIGRQLAE